MEGLGNEFLARTALAVQTDGGIGGGKLCDLPQNLLHRRADRDDLRKVCGVVSHQAARRTRLSRVVQGYGLLHVLEQLCMVEGLGEIGVGSFLGGLHRTGNGGMRGHHDDRERGPGLVQVRQHSQPVFVTEAEIDQGQIIRFLSSSDRSTGGC
jgi:hypothetical protein